MRNKYHIFEDDEGDVHISLKNDEDYVNAFISLWMGDEDAPSIFKSSEDAVLFAEIIVKLLDIIGDNRDIK